MKSSREFYIKNIKNNNEYSVYIGRSTKEKKENPLCNPYSIGYYGTRDKCIQMFAYDFRVKWKLNPEFRYAVLASTGKTLGCFCYPLKCHGDVIHAFTEGFKSGGEDKAFDCIQEFILDV